MFIFSHFLASVTFAKSHSRLSIATKTSLVQVGQSQDLVLIHTDAYVSVYAHTYRLRGSNMKTEKITPEHTITCVTITMQTNITDYYNAYPLAKVTDMKVHSVKTYTLCFEQLPVNQELVSIIW